MRITTELLFRFNPHNIKLIHFFTYFPPPAITGKYPCWDFENEWIKKRNWKDYVFFSLSPLMMSVRHILPAYMCELSGIGMWSAVLWRWSGECEIKTSCGELNNSSDLIYSTISYSPRTPPRMRCDVVFVSVDVARQIGRGLTRWRTLRWYATLPELMLAMAKTVGLVWLMIFDGGEANQTSHKEQQPASVEIKRGEMAQMYNERRIINHKSAANDVRSLQQQQPPYSLFSPPSTWWFAGLSAFCIFQRHHHHPRRRRHSLFVIVSTKWKNSSSSLHICSFLRHAAPPATAWIMSKCLLAFSYLILSTHRSRIMINKIPLPGCLFKVETFWGRRGNTRLNACSVSVYVDGRSARIQHQQADHLKTLSALIRPSPTLRTLRQPIERDGSANKTEWLK